MRGKGLKTCLTLKTHTAQAQDSQWFMFPKNNAVMIHWIELDRLKQNIQTWPWNQHVFVNNWYVCPPHNLTFSIWMWFKKKKTCTLTVIKCRDFLFQGKWTKNIADSSWIQGRINYFVPLIPSAKLHECDVN